MRKRHVPVVFFECFPYVCPEPVLVKRSGVYTNGSKLPFPRTFRPQVEMQVVFMQLNSVAVARPSIESLLPQSLTASLPVFVKVLIVSSIDCFVCNISRPVILSRPADLARLRAVFSNEIQMSVRCMRTGRPPCSLNLLSRDEL